MNIPRLQKYRLLEMTRPEVEQAIASGVDTVIATFGSTEQHGLHLPLGTDSLWGEELGDRIACALGDALLAPGLRLGCSEHHMAFAGSLTLSGPTFIQVVTELCRSFAHHGFHNLVLIPTHGGNFRPLAQAVESIRAELPGVNLIAITDLAMFMDEVFRVAKKHGVTAEQAGGHSGEHETSLMLAIHPNLVNMQVAQPGYMGDQLSIAPVVFQKGFRAVTENGVLGDPRGGAAATGEDYFTALTDFVVQYVHAHRRTKPA